MAFPIGVLQGRLSPSENGRFQFFPSDWKAEFVLAKQMGFSSIEWLLDFVGYEKNPLLSVRGREEIARVAKGTGVSANSICADYYMKYRFDKADKERSLAILGQLIEAAKKTNGKLILVPLLEVNAPRNEDEKRAIIIGISSLLPRAREVGVRIGFETEMPRKKLSLFLDAFSSDAVGVYYDIGNATSYGFDCASDIRFFGKRIFGIHAKDKKKGSTQSITLGTGDADYRGCFKALHEIGFSGTIIMQAWRGENYLKDAEKQLLFLKSL